MKLNLCLKSLKILMIQFIDLENVAILKYCYDNYKYNSDIDAFIEKISAVQEETNILQESMEEGIYKTVSSSDEKDDEESKEKKGGRADQLPVPTF